MGIHDIQSWLGDAEQSRLKYGMKSVLKWIDDTRKFVQVPSLCSLNFDYLSTLFLERSSANEFAVTESGLPGASRKDSDQVWTQSIFAKVFYQFIKTKISSSFTIVINFYACPLNVKEWSYFG